MTPQPATVKPGERELDAFAAAWNEFLASIRRARGRAARDLGPGELSLAQFALITTLADEPQMTVGALALAGGVASPTATRMLATLERDGIVSRRQADDDKRRVHVALTAKGKKIVANKRAKIAAKQEIVFSMLSPAEREQAEHILRRLAAAVEEL